MGLRVIRADLVGHRVLEFPHVKRALVERYGKGILKNGRVDRGALAQRVFGISEELRFLNALTHPEIKKIVERDIKGEKGPVALEAALLFEISLTELCNVIICTYCSKETQIKRLLKKGLSLREALARLASQKPPEYYASRAHVVINTEADLKEVKKSAERVIQQLKEGKWVLPEAK